MGCPVFVKCQSSKSQNVGDASVEEDQMALGLSNGVLNIKSNNS